MNLEPDFVARRPFALPAWGFSLLVHFVLFMLLALFVRTAAPAVGIDADPERSVGIVLASRDENREQVYFDEQQALPENTSTGAAESRESADSAGAAGAFPAAGQAPPLAASLALPALEGPFAANDNALANVTLSPQGRPGLGSRAGEAEIIAADLAAQAAARRGRPSGPQAQVSLFGSAPAAGHSFVFVIDRSQSMGDAQLGVLRAAEEELAEALTALAANHKFQLIVYNKTPLPFHSRGLVVADEENKARAIAYVRDLVALGGTGHFAALLAALRLQPDAVFLLTDGGDPRLTDAEIDEVARQAGRRTHLTCLQFGFGPAPEDNATMRDLAARTGGSYTYIDMAERD